MKQSFLKKHLVFIGFDKIVDDLVKCNADINIENKNKDTPLIVAVKEGNLRLCFQLLKFLVFYSLKEFHSSEFDEFLNFSKTFLKLLKIICHNYLGRNEIVDFLLENYAVINSKNIDGNTALHIAVSDGAFYLR